MTTRDLAWQKYDIITWLTGLNDANLVANLYALSKDSVLHLQSAQIEMLKMSDLDIANDRLITEEELEKQDEKCFC